MNYYIADLHLGHANIIKHSHRPFKNVDEMDKTIINNWNSVVTDNDDIWIIGDFLFKVSDPTIYLKQLKGKKHLIIGNHDQWIKNKSYHSYFESIDHYREIVDGNTRVVLFHYPIAEWNGFYRDSVHLFGHIHNNENDACKIMKQIKNCYNVGADILGFTPMTLKQIIKLYN